MRGLYWRSVRQDELLAHQATGRTRSIRMELPGSMIDNRPSAVVAFAVHAKVLLKNTAISPATPTVREMLRQMFGTVLLPGRNSVGLVPAALPADYLAYHNVGLALPNTFRWGQPGGIPVPQQQAAAEERSYEATIILPYAARALSVNSPGRAGRFDGAIDSGLFQLSPPTLTLTGVGADFGEWEATSLQLTISVCFATTEPGRSLAPTKPEIVLLGEVLNNPDHFGVGQLRDVQLLQGITRTPGESLAAQAYLSAASAACEVDATEITEGPWHQIVRQPLLESANGLAYNVGAPGMPEDEQITFLAPSAMDQASQRHVGRQITIEGWDSTWHDTDLIGHLVGAPEADVLDTWARLRGVDRAQPAVHGVAVGDLGLSNKRFIGISPMYTASR